MRLAFLMHSPIKVPRSIIWLLFPQGVVVVDRLSSFHIGSVRDATGGQLISSFSLHYPPQWLGRLKNINSISFEGKR